MRLRLRRAVCLATIFGAAVPLLGAGVLWWVGWDERTGPCDVALVLGNAVSPEGVVSERLRARLDRSVELYLSGLVKKIIASGGVDARGTDEAEHMARYLFSRGVPKEAVVVHSGGNNSYLSAKFAAQGLREGRWDCVTVVSQFYHVPRVRLTMAFFGTPARFWARPEYVEKGDFFRLLREVAACVRYFFHDYRPEDFKAHGDEFPRPSVEGVLQSFFPCEFFLLSEFMRILPKRRTTRLHYAATESDADMFYATRFFAPDAFWYLEHNGRRLVFLNDLEIDRARRETSGIDVISWSDVEKKHNPGGKSKRDTSTVMGRYLRNMGVRSVEVPGTFPLGVAAKLSDCGVRCRPAKGAFFPEREIKSESEQRWLAEAQHVAERAMACAREILRECKWSRDGVLKWRGHTLDSRRLRSELQIVLARSGAHCDRLIVAGGDEACDPHEVGHGPLRAGEMIIVDIFPRMSNTGCWGDITRTFCVGRPRSELAALHAAVLAAQKRALKEIRDGCDGKKLFESVKRDFSAKGYVTGIQDGRNVGFFHGLGHGVGLEIHEAPRISGGKLRAGQTVTVEPGLYYPGLGGVRIEDLVVVTETGCKNLTTFPKDWRVQR